MGRRRGRGTQGVRWSPSAGVRAPPPTSTLFLPGRRDSSGIRLYYTATLRRFDAGIMELGLVYTPLMAIPPQETAFVLTGYCTDKCTQMVSGAGRAPAAPSPQLPGRGPMGGEDDFGALLPRLCSFPMVLPPLCAPRSLSVGLPLQQQPAHPSPS